MDAERSREFEQELAGRTVDDSRVGESAGGEADVHSGQPAEYNGWWVPLPHL